MLKRSLSGIDINSVDNLDSSLEDQKNNLQETYGNIELHEIREIDNSSDDGSDGSEQREFEEDVITPSIYLETSSSLNNSSFLAEELTSVYSTNVIVSLDKSIDVDCSVYNDTEFDIPNKTPFENENENENDSDNLDLDIEIAFISTFEDANNINGEMTHDLDMLRLNDFVEEITVEEANVENENLEITFIPTFNEPNSIEIVDDLYISPENSLTDEVNLENESTEIFNQATDQKFAYLVDNDDEEITYEYISLNSHANTKIFIENESINHRKYEVDLVTYIDAETDIEGEVFIDADDVIDVEDLDELKKTGKIDIESVYDNWQYTRLTNDNSSTYEILNFDWKQYIENYQDLRDSGINTKEKAWYHWMNHGKNEGRKYDALNKKAEKDTNAEEDIVGKETREYMDEDFDWKQYIKNYKDLDKAGITTQKEAWYHWTNHGKFEGRTYFTLNTKELDEFHWEEYVSNYSDLKKNGVNTKEKAWHHWLNHGKFEGRTYFSINTDEEEQFNWKEYVSHYVDLSKDGLNTKEKAWYHWINHGKHEGRHYFSLDADEYDLFDWKEYVSNYDDLQEDEMNTKELAWHHWIYHGKQEGRTYFSVSSGETLESPIDDYETFNWKQYLLNYNDLVKGGIKTKENAWHHWINHGKPEGRVTYNLYEEECKEYDNYQLENHNNIFLKQKYDRYGMHYFGWKGVMNDMVQRFKNAEEKKYIHKIFVDDWIEKFLVWGNKVINTEYLNQIETNDYKLISFIHNPPFLQWNNKKLQKQISTEMVLGDNTHFNENVFNEIYKHNLPEKFIYLYTLSNNHKEYIYNNYPEFKDKILSVHHPIDLNTPDDSYFDIRGFLQTKKIYHIGWWLRNFKTFIDFEAPPEFDKIILVKNDFVKPFNNSICKNNDMSSVHIQYEINNDRYEKIFKNCCVFADIVDCIANNTVLECIKFNTPIILRRTKSAEEYLGKDYPLFFDSPSDLVILKEESFLLDLVVKTHAYLKQMNKKHVELETFNKKITYDLSKLVVNESPNILTWNVFIDDKVKELELELFTKQFIYQHKLEDIHLLFFVKEDVNSEIIDIIHNYSKLHDNIRFRVINEEVSTFNQQMYIVSKNIQTTYATILPLQCSFDEKYSFKMIEYLDNNPACDIALSSYKLIDNHNHQKVDEINLEKNKMFFASHFDKGSFENNGIVWRTNIHSFLGEIEIDNDNYIFYHWIRNNLNMFCVSNEPLYSIHK